MRTPSRTPMAAVAALVLLFASSACAPGPRCCSTQSDRFFDGERGFTRERNVEVHPIEGVVAVVLAAASTLAGNGCEWPSLNRLAASPRHPS